MTTNDALWKRVQEAPERVAAMPDWMRGSPTNTREGEMSEKGERRPIDRPCSACSAGDTKMEYHLHQPPFREMSEKDAPKSQHESAKQWMQNNGLTICFHSPGSIGGASTTDLLCIYASALRSELAAAQKEVERLTERLRSADAYFPTAALEKVNAEQRSEAAEKEVERLTHDLQLNASMLAKQCDLARDAENKQTASEQREQAMREALEACHEELCYIMESPTLELCKTSNGKAAIEKAYSALHTEEPHV